MNLSPGLWVPTMMFVCFFALIYGLCDLYDMYADSKIVKIRVEGWERCDRIWDGIFVYKYEKGIGKRISRVFDIDTDSYEQYSGNILRWITENGDKYITEFCVEDIMADDWVLVD